MEQTYFYLTITGEDDAYAIKEKYDLRSFDAYNQGDIVEHLGNLQFDRMCLIYQPIKDESSLDVLFICNYVGKWLTLPSNLQKTLHLACHSSTERQNHGGYIPNNIIKDMAVLQANFLFHAELHKLSPQFEYPFTYFINSVNRPKSDISWQAKFRIHSYRFTLAEITKRLGIQPTKGSYNFSDLRKPSQQPYNFTSFQVQVEQDFTIPIEQQIANLVTYLYAFKNEILALGNEVDISYSMSVTGHTPDEYEFEIDKANIQKMAELRLSIDFDMYFANNY